MSGIPGFRSVIDGAATGPWLVPAIAIEGMPANHFVTPAGEPATQAQVCRGLSPEDLMRGLVATYPGLPAQGLELLVLNTIRGAKRLKVGAQYQVSSNGADGITLVDVKTADTVKLGPAVDWRQYL